MARRPNILRPITLNTTLPEDLRAKLDLHLFSEVEGRVPKGAYQRLITELLNQYFNRKPSRSWLVYNFDTARIQMYEGEDAEAQAKSDYNALSESARCRIYSSVES